MIHDKERVAFLSRVKKIEEQVQQLYEQWLQKGTAERLAAKGSSRYNLKGKLRKSWINVINPFRGLLVIGSPSARKSWFVI